MRTLNQVDTAGRWLIIAEKDGDGKGRTLEQVHAAGDGMEILHLQGEEVSGIGFDRAKIKGNDLNRFF